MAFMTVEWSLPLKKRPMSLYVKFKTLRIIHMEMWRAKTTSLRRLLPKISDRVKP